jgi:hypothetical protein
MEQNLDDLIDKIIVEEGKRYTSMTVDGREHPNPSYFMYIKQMYIKSWDGPLNPNNVFIPYILVSIEAILRQIISIDSKITKRPVYPRDILKRLVVDEDSPLVNVKPDIIYTFWYPKENNPEKMSWVAETLGNGNPDDLLIEISDILKLDKEKIVVRERDKKAFLSNLYKVLKTIYNRYYLRNDDTGQGAYRNKIMHANKSLLLEENNTFSEILNDYYSLIRGIWGDEIMHFEKNKPKTPWMF